MSNTRKLTPEETDLVQFAFTELEYNLEHDYYSAKVNGTYFYSDTPEGPWKFSDSGNEVTTEIFIGGIPHSRLVSQINPKTLQGVFNNKAVRFS
jgi:hypothetical protein